MKRLGLMIGTGVMLYAWATAPALAEMRPNSFNFTPFVGGYLFEGNQDLKDDPLLGAGIGYDFSTRFGTEAVFNYVSTTNELSGADMDTYVYHLDGLFYLLPNQTIQPYLAAGAGGITFNPTGGDSDTDWLVNYGLGLKYFMTDNLALRTDVRHIISFDDHHNNLAYSVGFTYQFAGEREARAAAPPAPEPAPTPAAPRDSDGDGVPDDRDDCPDTPPGTPVDSRGCPKDSDGDGVYDHLDKCPDTQPGVKVDASGCPLERQVCVYLDVMFDFDRWEIKPAYHDNLQQIAEFLKSNPETKATIKGYTDYVGTEEYNLKLSERRAQSIKLYLVDNFGIDPDRLATVGLGKTRPLATNETEFGRQLNRRAKDVICTFEIQFIQ